MKNKTCSIIKNELKQVAKLQRVRVAACTTIPFLIFCSIFVIPALSVSFKLFFGIIAGALSIFIVTLFIFVVAEGIYKDL